VAQAPLALFVSRIHPVKNLEALLAAWPLVLADLPAARLVVAGEGEARYVRGVRARACGLEASVRFTGFVSGEEKAQLLREARAFVLPSHHENLGFAVLEALAAGVPAVVTPEVQVADLVQANGLGAVTAADPPALARALVRVLRDDALVAACRQRGPALVAERFSEQSVAAGLARMYRAAIQSTAVERT
jgi:glycosyltransferase involved in cell wall biosynthesis